MLLDFDEHMYHRRIMQEAFVRTRLAGYTEHVDKVVSQVIANDWVANDARFLLYPAMKELTLDIASMVFMGHEPGTDRELVTKVNRAFTITTRAGNAIIRTSVPPFTWWRGLKAREYLEHYFEERVKERRGKDGTDLLTVLCQSEDEDGNKFSDEDIVNHMIFLMMAAHDTSTSTATTMSYYLAANPGVAGPLPRRVRPARRRPAGHRVAGEAGNARPGDERVHPAGVPVQWAMRQTVRDTELLGYYLPEGTIVIAYPGMNHRLAEIYPEPYKFDPERFAEPRNEHKKHRYGVHPVRRRRAQMHRHGVRPARDQDDHAPAVAPVPPGTTAARLRAALGLRRHAGADGRHADRVASASLDQRCSSQRRLADRSISALAVDACRDQARWRGSGQI